MQTPAIVEGPYLADILAQAQAVEATVQSLKVTPRLDNLVQRLSRGHFQRLVLTGMGSSFHALHPLHQELTAQGFTAIMAETSELLFHLSGLIRSGTLLIVVSQSGASIEIVRLLDRLPPDSEMIAITNTPDSPLAQRATATLVTHAGQEFSVSCKTYLAALAALAWLSAVLRGEDLTAARSELAQAAPAIARYLQHWRHHVAQLQHDTEGVQSLFLTGRGPSLATAGVGGLIIKESAHVHAEGMSSAAFRHGPFEMISSKTFVLVFHGTPATAHLNERLFEDVRRAGGRSALVTQSDQTAWHHLPAAPIRLLPILEMLPVEMISLALSANAGREAGTFHLGSKITTVE